MLTTYPVLAATTAKSLQSCPTLCSPIDGSPLGSSVPGILQARTLEWVAISFSSAWKWKVKVTSLSHVPPLATHGLQPTRLLHPWEFPGKSTGVSCCVSRGWPLCLCLYLLSRSPLMLNSTPCHSYQWLSILYLKTSGNRLLITSQGSVPFLSTCVSLKDFPLEF